MTIRFLLFDLDETLYPRSAGIMRQIGVQIRRFIVDTLGLSLEEADAIARRYHRDYGTTLQGLLANHRIDPDAYLNFVHNFPLDSLASDQLLDALLSSLPGEKVIFTNADRAHAERVLQKLGIRHHFSRIIDVVAVGYVSKPNLEAYTSCLKLLEARPEECVMIEDSGHNLQPAAALGMATVLVDGAAGEQADYYIDSVLDLQPVIEAICAASGCNPAQTIQAELP